MLRRRRVRVRARHLTGATMALRIAGVASLLLLAAGASSAASFDCSRARTPVENTICVDPLLGKLDEALARNYELLLAASSAGGAQLVKRAQVRWLANRNGCKDWQCVVDAYRLRLDQTCSNGGVAGVHLPCTAAADLLPRPRSAATARACPITERQLLGSWQRQSGSAFYQAMSFADGPDRRFDASLHGRPEVSAGIWSLEDCSVVIEHPLATTPDTESKVLGYQDGRLTLQDQVGHATATYRRMAEPAKTSR